MTRLAFAVLLVFTLSACAGGEEVEWVPREDKLREGPGLWTGDDGAWKVDL